MQGKKTSKHRHRARQCNEESNCNSAPGYPPQILLIAIGKNANLYINYNVEFKEDYEKWIYVDTIDECESMRLVLEKKYQVEKGSWLANMYEYCQFCMTSSQRSESINSLFDGFVNAQAPVSKFVI